MLDADDPSHRQDAIYALGDLGSRESRDPVLSKFLHDSNRDVRQTALIELCELFRGERDQEILHLALEAYDNPESPTSLRLAAGAVMMYQLEIPHDEKGGPGWWNGEEQDLKHPSIMRAVQETRDLLEQGQD
jgi:hypothetical protein